MPEARGCMDVAGMRSIRSDVAEAGKRFEDAQIKFEKKQQAEIDASLKFDAARRERDLADDELTAANAEYQAKLDIAQDAADDQAEYGYWCSRAAELAGKSGSSFRHEPSMKRGAAADEMCDCRAGKCDGCIYGASVFLFEREDSEPRRIPDSIRSGAQAREIEEEREAELERLRDEVKRLRDAARHPDERPAKRQQLEKPAAAQKSNKAPRDISVLVKHLEPSTPAYARRPRARG